VAHSVFVVDTVARVAASLNKTDRRAYDAAISGLKGEGCKAAGYRRSQASLTIVEPCKSLAMIYDCTDDRETGSH